MSSANGNEMLEYGTIETALHFLKENRSYPVGDIGLSSVEPGIFNVSGESNCWLWSSITKESALIELEEVALLFEKMLVASPELKEFIADRSIRFNLYYNDSGKASIPICTKQDNIVKWISSINR